VIFIVLKKREGGGGRLKTLGNDPYM
jgi:hypothetical protein